VTPSALSTKVGSIALANPVMTAAGTAGHGAELNAYFDLASIGAVVVKSLAIHPWAGNPAPRVYPVASGMLNSVGLQGPGVAAWLARDVPELERIGATVVASIWGRTVEEFGEAASALADAPPCVVAVELNVSCPNLEDRSTMFAHSATATAAAVAASTVCNRPVWAKLSPNVSDLATIAGAALGAGAEAVTLVNTLLGLAIDLDRRSPVLGAGRGGLSGRAVHPVAVRAVYDVRAAFPNAAIVGVGGVADAASAIELLLAGANAVQVGTATLADPRAPARVLAGIEQWCERHDVVSLDEIISAAHRSHV
jgi:dihydroorotate dehydrogenase (NAD+) catalytic subunit